MVVRIQSGLDPRQFVYVYVDNLGVLGTDRKAVERAMSSLQAKFGEYNLELHASEVSSGDVEALGCLVDCSRLRSCITPQRLWKLRQAIKGLLRRGRCTGRALEVVVGHLTFVGLMNRRSLSVLHACYRFIQACYYSVSDLWDSVVAELSCFKGLLMLLTQDWWRPWNTVVSSSDSSLTGYGVCQSTWPVEVVAEVGRQRERQRFKRTGPHSARESALVAAGLERGPSGTWQAASRAADGSLGEAGWEADDSFIEVPARWLRRHLWSPTLWGRWCYKESITVLEARAVLKSLKRLLMTAVWEQHASASTLRQHASSLVVREEQVQKLLHH